MRRGSTCASAHVRRHLRHPDLARSVLRVRLGGQIAAAGCPSCVAQRRALGPAAADAGGSHGLAWLFLAPAAILAVFWLLSFAFVRDTPSRAGLVDFDVADASSGQERDPRACGRGDRADAAQSGDRDDRADRAVLGLLRQGILKWSNDFARSVHANTSYVFAHWGLVSCIAGIMRHGRGRAVGSSVPVAAAADVDHTVHVMLIGASR